MSAHNFVGYIVADKQQRIVASTNIELIGQTVPEYETFLTARWRAKRSSARRLPASDAMKDENGRVRTGVPTMFVVRAGARRELSGGGGAGDADSSRAGVHPDPATGPLGETGETYAIDKDGLLVSNSRFDDELICWASCPIRKDAQSILNVSARDPGGNMTQGFRPSVRRANCR